MRFVRALLQTIVASGFLVSAAPAVQAQSLKDAPGIVTSWSGVYVGLHGGYAWADLDWTTDYPFGNPLTRPSKFDSSGAVWGGQLGIQTQRDRWVFGAEVSLSGGFDDDNRRGIDLFGGSAVGEMRAKVDGLMLVTGRLGYSWGTTLGYVKGGYALARVQLNTDDNVPGDFISSSRAFYDGWTAGTGFEYQFTPNIIFGLEYNFVQLSGSKSALITDEAFALVSAHNSKVDLDIHSLQARLSFKFGFMDGR